MFWVLGHTAQGSDQCTGLHRQARLGREARAPCNTIMDVVHRSVSPSPILLSRVNTRAGEAGAPDAPPEPGEQAAKETSSSDDPPPECPSDGIGSSSSSSSRGCSSQSTKRGGGITSSRPPGKKRDHTVATLSTSRHCFVVGAPPTSQEARLTILLQRRWHAITCQYCLNATVIAAFFKGSNCAAFFCGVGSGIADTSRQLQKPAGGS
jgi:hypothetical protein